MKRVLLLLGIMSSITFAMAEENVLQTIEIEPVKDTYNIILVSDKAVDVKKNVQASNKITLNLKDIRASKTLNTIYNNVDNVDTVMVEPQGNGINIFFQAENAEKATVSFDALTKTAPVTKPINQTKNLKLNNPIESYAPIYSDEYQNEKKSNLFSKLKKSPAADSITDSIDEDTVSDLTHKGISYGLVGLFAFALLKLFKRKEPEMQIGLTQSLNDREIEMYKGNQPVGINYSTPEKPFTTVNYGLNAYQKVNRNPYETSPIQYHNPKLRGFSAQKPQQSAIHATMSTQPIQTQMATAVQPQVKKHTTPVNTAPVNQSNPNIDNLKFLESMTAIYEKSGRHDLAKGLKDSLSKNLK